MDSELHYALLSEAELNDLLAGKPSDAYGRWPTAMGNLRFSPGFVGVLWEVASSSRRFPRPIAIVAPPEEHRRLFNRFSHLRSDLTPLSAWCHLVPPNRFASLHDPVRETSLRGFEAAWAGLAVAEAQLLSGRPISQLKIPGCLATQSYAVGRTGALWGRVSLSEILERYDSVQRLVRTNEPSTLRIRKALEPVWSALMAVSTDGSGGERLLVAGVLKLAEAREGGGDEAYALEEAFRDLPEAAFLRRLPNATPEARLKEFDALVVALGDTTMQPARKANLAFLAGYLATVAAGGAPSLGLAEDIANSWPEVTAWAYVLGSIGERVTWTSSFDGLGRLVTRELSRPFRLDEAPSCDFALDEALVVVDKHLSDPLVHLRVKQLRVVTVSLYPGVNIAVGLGEQATELRRQTAARGQTVTRPASADVDLVDLLVKALIPRIREELSVDAPVQGGTRVFGSRTAKPKGKKVASQSKLPLGDE